MIKLFDGHVKCLDSVMRSISDFIFKPFSLIFNISIWHNVCFVPPFGSLIY